MGESIRVALIGRGVVGSRVAHRIPIAMPSAEIVDIDTRNAPDSTLEDLGAAVLACPAPHAAAARTFIERGVDVVSISDQFDDVADLLELHDLASNNEASLVVGAAMDPGLSGLLARQLVDQLATCDEIHIAAHGTAGPACARQHHDALAGTALGLDGGQWITRSGGTGRELCWFPEPVGAYDCYRAELASPLLVRDLFGDLTRMSARMSATRRDRLTARLPMLSPPHREGGVGALRVEARGSDHDGSRCTLVSGVAELAGTAAAATATAMLRAASIGSLPHGVVRLGDPRLDTIGILHTVQRLGVRLQEFTGVASPLSQVLPT